MRVGFRQSDKVNLHDWNILQQFKVPFILRLQYMHANRSKEALSFNSTFLVPTGDCIPKAHLATSDVHRLEYFNLAVVLQIVSCSQLAHNIPNHPTQVSLFSRFLRPTTALFHLAVDPPYDRCYMQHASFRTPRSPRNLLNWIMDRPTGNEE